MSIAKMSLVNLTGSMEQLDQVLLKLSRQEHFHQEQAPFVAGNENGFVRVGGENPYAALLSQATDVGLAMGYSLERQPNVSGTEKIAGQQEMKQFLDRLQQALSQLREQERGLSAAVEQHQNVLVQLGHIEGLDVDVDELLRLQYLKMRMGRLSADSLAKLSYYSDKPFVFVSFDFDGQYHWGAYFTVEAAAPEIDDIFSSLFFEPMHVSSEIHGMPGEASKFFLDKLEEEKHNLEVVQKKLKMLLEDNREQFFHVYGQLSFLQDTYEMRRYVYALNGLFYIVGFVPADDMDAFTKEIEEIPTAKVLERPADSDKRLTVPTKLKNNWFAKPFEMFVEMFGIPTYNDIDPTPFVAFTYSFLFGMMFGDVGQGLVISLVGFLLWKYKKMALGRVMERIGIFSAAFGFVYGSVFGFEHLLDGFYRMLGFAEKPVEVMANSTTTVILLAAVGMGAVLIAVCILMNICIGLKQRDLGRAVFSQNGVAGLVFYLYVLAAAVGMLVLDINLLHPVCILLFAVVPLLAIFLKEIIEKKLSGAKDIKPEAGIGGYIIENFFELFEVVLSFITNTMSFLRVGGFVLSHAGMMAVVFTLSEMFSAGASPVIVVIGNIFVMCMEGLIVGIQVLRLEFYEIFSRFYEGGGKPFVPVSQRAAQ